jgi:hypothetical protein
MTLFVASLVTSNQWLWRYLLLLWLHQTNDYDGICCFSCYIKPMTMTVFVASLVTSNQWLWRYLLLLWLHQTNDYDGICCFSAYIKPMNMTLLLWLHQTNDYDVASLVTSNQWLWRYFSGYIKPMTMTVFVASPLSMQHSGEKAKTGWLGIRIMCQSGRVERLVYPRTFVSVS